MVSTKGLSKEEVLAALYNAADIHGSGFCHGTDRKMDYDWAKRELSNRSWFDYIHGKIMKVDLFSDNGFEERSYDRYNSSETAQQAIDILYRHHGIRKENINYG